jgi:lipopolysaccharide export system protein LptC
MRENRYTQLVTGLKIVLPLVALGILSTLFLLSDPPDPERAIPYAEVDVAQLAREMRLTRPRYAGMLDDGREITLVAETATPDFEATDVIVTDTMEGRVALGDGAFVYLDAGDGRIDMAGRVADLGGGVEAETTEGWRILSGAMRVRLAELGVVAPGDVRIEGPGLEIDAGGMDLSGAAGEEIVHFTGGVRVLYRPE